METYEFHEDANRFPLLDDDRLRELGMDIAQHGLANPIVLHEGKILDGRNRYLACQRYAPHRARFERIYASQLPGRDTLQYVVSQNLHRRHLDATDRARIADEINSRLPGGRGGDRRSANRPKSEGPFKSLGAKIMGIGQRSVDRVKKIRAQGSPQLQQAVFDEKRIGLRQAEQLAGQPEQQQLQLAAPVVPRPTESDSDLDRKFVRLRQLGGRITRLLSGCSAQMADYSQLKELCLQAAELADDCWDEVEHEAA